MRVKRLAMVLQRNRYRIPHWSKEFCKPNLNLMVNSTKLNKNLPLDKHLKMKISVRCKRDIEARISSVNKASGRPRKL